MLHYVAAWEKALAEAVRVLRPGGLLIGYDLLDSTPVRLLHFGGGHDTRLLRPGQLEAELGRLPATNIRIRPSIGKLTVKFAASKPHKCSTAPRPDRSQPGRPPVVRQDESPGRKPIAP
jgi:SAM-dependent methyltransferase